MKREFRAHPLMLARLLKPFLFVLVLPVLEGAVQYLTRRSFSHFFILELLAVSLILLLSFLRWRRFRFLAKMPPGLPRYCCPSSGNEAC